MDIGPNLSPGFIAASEKRRSVTMKDFFDNVLRYPRYFISFTLGILYSAVQPLVPLLQRPTTAVALIGAVIAGFVCLTLTLRAMLGLGAV